MRGERSIRRRGAAAPRPARSCRALRCQRRAPEGEPQPAHLLSDARAAGMWVRSSTALPPPLAAPLSAAVTCAPGCAPGRNPQLPMVAAAPLPCGAAGPPYSQPMRAPTAQPGAVPVVAPLPAVPLPMPAAPVVPLTAPHAMPIAAPLAVRGQPLAVACPRSNTQIRIRARPRRNPCRKPADAPHALRVLGCGAARRAR